MNSNNDNMDLVSVIVPAYNVGRYVKRCLDTIVGQTYRNIEILVIDDGSTDETGRICDEIARTDERICVIHQANQGLSGARNTGLDHAKGSYVLFVDSDDWINKDMVRFLHSLAKEYNAQIAACGTEVVDDNGHVAYHLDDLEEIKVFSKIEAMKELPHDQRIRNVAWNKLYSKSLFEATRFPVGMIFEDIATTYALVDKADCVVYSGKPLYYYYKSDTSILRSAFSAKWFDKVTACKMRADYYRTYYSGISQFPSLLYVNSVFNLLAKSYAERRKLSAYRGAIKQDLLSWIDHNKSVQLPLSHKVSLAILGLSLPLYDATIGRIYLNALKRRKGKMM